MKMSGIWGRKNRVACALALSMLPAGAWAFIDGEVITKDRIPHIYNIPVVSESLTENRAGATITVNFNLNTTYDAYAFCSEVRRFQPIYFEGRTTLAPTSDGYVYLNEYMDAKIAIHIEGDGNGELAVPFPATSNKMTQNTCRLPEGMTTGYLLTDIFRSGSRGSVTFRLKKPLINGLHITSTEVAEVFGRLEAGDGIMGPSPLAKVVIDQAIITVPDKCVVNEGQPVVVDFGQIPNSAEQIARNTQLEQDVKIRVKCEGGSFATPNAKVRIGILQGSPASFNSDYLSTTGPVDRSDLGISLTDNTTNQQVVPNTFYDFIDLNSTTGTPGPFEGVWSLTAKPVAKSGTMIPEGDFQASATIVTVFE